MLFPAAHEFLKTVLSESDLPNRARNRSPKAKCSAFFCVLSTAIRCKKFGRRVARGNPELSGFPLQTNNCFHLFATGGPPGVIQRRGVVAKGEMHKAGQATGAPGFNFITFMFFMVNLPFLILSILSIPVKSSCLSSAFICVHLRHLWIIFSCL